jgi:hypothetical protein
MCGTLVCMRYESGMEFGLLTLEGKDFVGRNALGYPVYHGWWNARCRCEREVRINTSWIRARLKKGFACQQCIPLLDWDLPPTRPPAMRHQGQTYGRLVVGEWIERKGWECRCQVCGGRQYINRSSALGPKGASSCKGKCEHEHV